MRDLLERVQHWADATPGRVAHTVASAGATPTISLTYAQLAARAAALALHLGPGGEPVIVLGHKEPEMLVGFLAALESGRPYIPLDDSLPAHRVESVARASGARIILTPPQIAGLPAAAGRLQRLLEEEDPFYIIFTSGSTGEPKGVTITAGCLEAFLGWMIDEQRLEPGAGTFLNQAPFSFDLSVMDLGLSLATGGTLFSLTRREVADFRALYATFARCGVTTWVSTPSFAQMCLAEKTFDAQRLPAARRFLFCGETLPAEIAARLLDRFPQAEVWNTYGPTEATVATTSVRVTREILAGGDPLPIGRPRPGTAILLLGEGGLPVAPGERGEIAVAGPNVSPGYLGRPDLTAQSFYFHEGQRAYRTGDWGRWRDGLLYCEGRRDLQLKLHGYRIELADIEANLRALPAVRDCAVAPVRKGETVTSLTAFVVLEDAGFPPAGLREGLAQRVPAYMLPRRIVILPFLPLTANGKTDRRQLGALAHAR